MPKTCLPSFFEEEYTLFRMEAAHCRSMGDIEGLKQAIRLSWEARRALRSSVATPE